MCCSVNFFFLEIVDTFCSIEIFLVFGFHVFLCLLIVYVMHAVTYFFGSLSQKLCKSIRLFCSFEYGSILSINYTKINFETKARFSDTEDSSLTFLLYYYEPSDKLLQEFFS